MLFNKKFISCLANLCAILMVFAVTLYVVMFIVGFFVNPPIHLLDVDLLAALKANAANSVNPVSPVIIYFSYCYIFLQKIFTFALIFLFIGGMYAVVSGSKLKEGFGKK